MVVKIKLSILYSVVVSGILVLAFILASFYVPLLEMDMENFVMNLTTNKFIITFIFDFVSLAAIALGFASLVQILENMQSSLVDGLLAVARTTSQTDSLLSGDLTLTGCWAYSSSVLIPCLIMRQPAGARRAFSHTR